jgi:hypothetical protein
MKNNREIALKFYQLSDVTNSCLSKRKQHFVSTDWASLIDFTAGVNYNKVIVYEDFSCAAYWASRIGINNVSFYHPDANFAKEVENQGIESYMNLKKIPKNIPQVGNPAFSKAEDIYLSLPSNQEVCMVLPAWAAVAPSWNANGWQKKQQVKKHIESIGLKEILWIPNGSFDQVSETQKKDTAQVDSVLIITEPGYPGDVKVTNLLDNTSYYCPRGGVYPRNASTLSFIDRFTQGNTLQFTEDQKKDNVADKWSLGVGIYNPFAKSKGVNGSHLKGLKIFAPGDLIKKNTCYEEFATEIEARKIYAHLTNDPVANAYQDLTTQKTLSSIMIRMLKV